MPSSETRSELSYEFVGFIDGWSEQVRKAIDAGQAPENVAELSARTAADGVTERFAAALRHGKLETLQEMQWILPGFPESGAQQINPARLQELGEACRSLAYAIAAGGSLAAPRSTLLALYDTLLAYLSDEQLARLRDERVARVRQRQDAKGQPSVSEPTNGYARMSEAELLQLLTSLESQLPALRAEKQRVIGYPETQAERDADFKIQAVHDRCRGIREELDRRRG